MRVVFSDPSPVASPDPPAVQLPLDDLLAASRVVTLHAPLDATTRHLFDERRLRSMRPGAFLVNTSRGPLVDEEALVRVLLEGHLAGVGLDVYEREPEVHPGLLPLPNVVLLPHLGSATAETRAAMAELAAANLVAVLEGREPPSPVVRGR
jgi:glyoxylate reductase